jgi:flagellar M-ring protein FliF
MDQLKQLLAALSLGQRITIVIAALVVGGGLYGLTVWNRERDFRPLYTGLAPEDAGQVLAKLHESGVEYRVIDGGAVLVPSAKVAELRLQMASAGLPKSGRIGFELFDKTNFGITDFAEQVNFRRAIEGELERSVMSLSEVEQARVHVTFPKDSVFVESREPAKASVMVRLRPGSRLSPPNVLAVCHLVASAVEGLAPEAVSVLDMQGNLLNRPRKPLAADGSEPSDGFLEYRQQIEKDLVAKIDGTLEPLLGPDKFRAGVSVECDFTSGEESEESFDPTKAVMTSSETTEDVSGASVPSGVPGTASTLPRPTSRPASSAGGITRRTENTAYQASRTVKHTRTPQGGVKRMSIAVLVDYTVRWEGSGAKLRRIVEPPPPEKLKAIQGLVAAATGLVSTRGDQLTVESLPFESTLAPEPLSAPALTAPPAARWPGWMQQIAPGLNPAVLLGAGAGVLLMLLVGAAFLWRRGSTRRAVPPEMRAELGAAGESPMEGAGRQLEAKLHEQAALKERMDAEALNALKLPAVTSKKAEILSKHLTDEVKKDPMSTAQILRSWVNERENRG